MPACEISSSVNDRLMFWDALQIAFQNKGFLLLTTCCSVLSNLQQNGKFPVTRALLSKPHLRATLDVGNKKTALFETPPPLYLIMKGAIFRSYLAAASSAWLKLEKDLPGGFWRLLADWLTDRVKDRLPSWLFACLVGWTTDWMTGHLNDEIKETHCACGSCVLHKTATLADNKTQVRFLLASTHNKHNRQSVIYRKTVDTETVYQ